ncbi:MAG: cupin domain-containing protein [Synergistaceae bacterium]|jgi:quercetin dioxygenase-like cupin family protein|nr:cupin domain-containing protein [Synergistaceae bacterium]
MRVFKCGEMKLKDDRPLAKAAAVHGAGLSMTRWEMETGAELSDHSHPHAQISFVVSGRYSFRSEGRAPYEASAGDFLIFEPNEPHGAYVLEGGVMIDAFCPEREDFKRELGWED